MTSALSSTVYAMELLELPKVMPITVRSPGAGAALEAPVSLIVDGAGRPRELELQMAGNSWCMRDEVSRA